MMTLDMDGVLMRFALLTGLDSDGAMQYQPLCADAAREIERGERDGCGPEASGPLISAAAALACYRWSLAQGCAGSGSFEAGDVKVEPGKRDVSAVRRLWRESLAAASPYLSDFSFLFRRTSP